MAQIISTGDGSHTLYVPELDEHYHSVHGAIQESEFIFIGSGFNFSEADPMRIFEVGFGTGLNALLTCIHSKESGRKVDFVSIEKYPLDRLTLGSLNYTDILRGESALLFEKIHKCPWDQATEITEYFSLLKIKGDLITDQIKGSYDLVFFDAFGPDKQPDMWSEKIIRKISESVVAGGIFVTYSVKGALKRSLRDNGFSISLLPGPPGKRQILRAVKS